MSDLFGCVPTWFIRKFQVLHQLVSSSDRATGHAAGYDLGQSRQIWIDPKALLNLVLQLLAGRLPHDPTSARRWPRKRAELPATVLSGSARVVELSYGGVKLEMPRPPGPGRTPLEIKLPTFGVSVQAVACWSHLAEEGGSWRCGAEVAPIDSDATRTWRWIVDSLN